MSNRSVKPDWYKHSWDHRYFRAYKDVLSEDSTKQDVDDVERLLELRPGMRVLDLCCGAGRHALLLASRGYDVVGIDLSRELLEVAKRESTADRQTVTWIRSDMRSIPFTESFDGVYNICQSFGYLESEQEDLKVLRSIAGSLRRGGKVLVEIPNRDFTGTSITAGG